MAEYQINIKKVSGEVLRIGINKGSIGVTVHISCDELVDMIIERGKLDENLMPPKPILDSFKESKR